MIQFHLLQDDKGRREKAIDFLKKHSPFSVIDSGQKVAEAGFVSECAKTPSGVHGIVREGELSLAVRLTFLNAQEIEGTCTCSSAEDMQEQWCQHAVAVFWRAADLGFFEPQSGFESSEATYRMSTSTPADIAAVISEIGSPTGKAAPEVHFLPQVKIVLETSSDRLGVKLFFDGEEQTPTIFEGLKRQSNRALDNILLRLLDDEGMWDETKNLWYINSSKGIEMALGLISEYREVRAFDGGKSVTLAHDILDAKLHIRWGRSSAELEMSWILPDGSLRPKDSELLGTGPFWTVINNCIYRISASAARIASIFSYNPTITLSRTQVGPLLEALTTTLTDSTHFVVENPEAQPETVIKQPTPVLRLERNEVVSEHFSSRQGMEIYGALEFVYPQPPSDKNLVYLPDRVKEREYSDFLKSRGFEYVAARKGYYISGDNALELVHSGDEVFREHWRVTGLDSIRKGIRFVDLSLNVALSTAQSDEDGPAKRGRIDWFDCHISLVQNNANVPISTLFKNNRSDNDRWIFLANGAYARVPGGTLHNLKTTLGMLDSNFKLSNTIKTCLSAAQAIGLSRISDDQVKLSLDQRLRELSKKLDNFDTIEQISTSKHFLGELRSYQREGLSWLNFLHSLELGGILADEMGLGKTVQALALIQHLKDRKGKSGGLTKPALIIAPTSVITNWAYEAKRFTPKLNILLLHGAGRKTHFSEIEKYDIVITSYALLRIDRFDLERYEFSYLILDEAQNIKNPEAATTKAAKAMQAKHRLALTGTPTENRPQELWSIFDFLMPGYLGSLEFFKAYIEKPILEGDPDVRGLKLLNNKTRPFILRRRKHEVEKDLPPKVESVLHVEMTDSQRQLYSSILEEVRPRIFDAISKKGIRGASISILAALLRLRQVCNHPNSIDSIKAVPGYDSGKFNLMKDLITEALENGHKILLFSQFREMLSIIRRWLDESAVSYLYLDGATKNRQELIDRFNNNVDSRLFLISLKAGGTGLNLASADTVIIYDPWWNPAVESQAVDRAHRIGQHRTVSVYRLVTENSVEQKIMDLKAKKAKIVDALINAEDSLSVLKLSKADLEQIFSPLPAEE